MLPERVVVPVVGTLDAVEPLAHALAAYPDADVVALAVIVPLDEPLSEGGVVEIDDERRADAEERVADVATAASERLAGADPEGMATPVADHRVVVREGRPADSIVEFVRESGAEHIVIAGRDRSTIEQLLLGDDLTTTVVERASVPVTVVP